MKNKILLLVSALLIFSACQPNSDFAPKENFGSSYDISSPNGKDGAPSDGSESNGDSCEEITSYLMCVSSSECEPVYETDLSEIPEGSEESLFLACIPKLPTGMPGSDSQDPKGPVVVAPPKMGGKPPSNSGEGEDDPAGDNPVRTCPGRNLARPNFQSFPGMIFSLSSSGTTKVSEQPALPKTCGKIAAKYLSVDGKKVMICHNSADLKQTIMIACSALAAHTSHHLDVLGSCKEEE